MRGVAYLCWSLRSNTGSLLIGLTRKEAWRSDSRMGWSTLIFQTFLFIGERILGVVDNLVAGEVWPRVKHMGYRSVALLIGLLLAPFVVVISDRVRKERRRMSENNQILDLVGEVGSQVSQTIYHSLKHSQTRPAVDRPPLSVQSDNVRHREYDSQLLDAQRPAPSDEDLQSVRYVSEAIVEIRATVSQHAQSATERDNQATERHNQLQNDIIKLQNDVVKLEPLILKLLDRFPSESMVFYSRNQVTVDVDAEQELRNTLQPNTESHSSKVFHKTVALKDQGSKAEWAQQLSLQVIRSMQLAYQIDKDYTFQIGSVAVAKYTDDGLKIWMLKEDWAPQIIDCMRSSWSLSDLMSGGLAIWTIKGLNLEGCELRAATAEKSETLKVLHLFKTNGGVDVLICEEPSIIQKSAPMFRDKIHIIASKIVEDVEQMMTFKLQSEAVSVKTAYGKAVVDGLTPSLWLAILLLVIIGATSNFWHQLGHLDTTVGLNFKDNSAVSYMWGKLPCYEMFLLYVLAILIPDMFARLWLLLQESFQPLGAAIVFYARTLAFARKQGSKIRCIFSSSSCAARTPYNIEEVSDQHQRLIEELWTPSRGIVDSFSSRSCATSRSDCLKELISLKEISERLKALREALKESSELRQRSMEEFLLSVDFRRTSSSSSCTTSPPDDKKKTSVHHQLTTAEQPWPIPMGSPFSSSFHAASLPNDIKKLNDSVYELYRPNGRPTMEIVFFHGLQLHAHEDAHRKTWLCMDEETLWPQQWLSKDFPCARILSISYDSSAVKSSSQGRLDMDRICENLVNDLILDSISNVGQNCPVVLVGHCVGGLLIKALCHSLNRKKHLLGSGNYEKDIKSLNIFLEDSKGGVMKEIALSVIGRKSSFKSGNRDRCQREVRNIDTFMGNMRGVFFYGTPHLGSTLADLPPRVPSTSPLIEYFRIPQVETAKLNEHFSQQRLRYGWRTYGMAEGQKTNFKGFNGMVVEEASARFDMDEFYTSTSSDHFTVCRPRATNDPAFTELSRFIVSLLSGSLQISIV